MTCSRASAFVFLLLLLSPLAQSADLWVKVEPRDLDKILQDARLALVIFADKDTHADRIKQLGIDEAVRLLVEDKQNIRILLVDPRGSELEKKYSLTAPEVRMFWKGIPLLPPNLNKSSPTTLFRWVKQNIRAASFSNLREVDTVAFFEKYKEKNPFIIVGLGPKDSPEARFLAEFAKNPRWTFTSYLIQEKFARTIFQSIGLGSGKFNIILINNLGKVIKEYTGDLDYLSFWSFLLDNTKTLGAVSIRGKESYIKDIASTGNPFVLVALNERSYSKLENGFLRKMRTLSNEYRLNVIYGVNGQKIHELFEYNDCDKDEDCLFVYKDYLYKAKKARYRFVLPNLDYSSFDKALATYKSGAAPQHFFSSSYRAPEIDSKFVVVSRESLPSLLAQNKDIFLFLYRFCGSNCADKLKYMTDALAEFSTDITLSAVTFAVANVSTNELPDDLAVASDVAFKFRRRGEGSQWVDLPNYSSGYYIAKDVAKHASEKVRLRGEEDEDFEDLL